MSRVVSVEIHNTKETPLPEGRQVLGFTAEGQALLGVARGDTLWWSNVGEHGTDLEAIVSWCEIPSHN